MRINDFGGNIDKWVNHAKLALTEASRSKEWYDRLGKAREPLDTLLEMWLWLANWGPNQKHTEADPDDNTPYGLEELPEFRALTNILATWCDHAKVFDPSPLLIASDSLQKIHDLSPVQGILVCPSEAHEPWWDQEWKRWHEARGLARILIHRIHLQLDLLPGSPEEKGRVEFNKMFDKIRDEWKDIVAVGLLFHSGGTMTKTAIAERLGYDGPGSLKRCPVFTFWTERGTRVKRGIMDAPVMKLNEHGEKTKEYEREREPSRIDRIREIFKTGLGRLRRKKVKAKTAPRGRKPKPKAKSIKRAD